MSSLRSPTSTRHFPARRRLPDAACVLWALCGLGLGADGVSCAADGPLQAAEKPALRTAGSMAAADDRLVPADVRQVRLPDSSVRPGGLACRVRAFWPGSQPSAAKAEWELRLTEFPDPGGEATFLLVSADAASAPADDELIGLDLGPVAP